MPGTKAPEETVLGYFKSLSNWGKWGPKDELGTINYITSERRLAATKLVKEGVTVSCAQLIVSGFQPDVQFQPLHYMTDSGEKWAGKKSIGPILQFSRDFIGMVFHGRTVTHIDSLAHVFWDGKMYNGVPAEACTTAEGATVESVDVIKDGIVARGVLLDIPRLRNTPYLDGGEAVYPEDLEAAEKAEGVKVQPGDVLLVRTGNHARYSAVKSGAPLLQGAGGMSGLQAASLPWLHSRQISILGSDGIQDVTPAGYPNFNLPVHQVGIVALGLWLLDNADLEGLAAACARYKRWEFMLILSPIRFQYATGSPVNPVAVF